MAVGPAQSRIRSLGRKGQASLPESEKQTEMLRTNLTVPGGHTSLDSGFEVLIQVERAIKNKYGGVAWGPDVHGAQLNE